MRWIIALFLLALALPARAGPLRLLVSIGNDRGLSEEEPLRYASRDARRMARLLNAIGKTRVDSTLIVTNQAPAATERALAMARSLAAGRRPRDVTFMLYFSGHGDQQHLHMQGKRLSMSKLEQLVSRVPASLRLMIIDACRTRGGARAKGITVENKPFAISLREPAGPRGTVVVFSSSAGEASQESDELGGAVFTHFLLSGLRGAADRDGDRRVTFDEAYAYAYHRTLRRSAAASGALQRPAMDLRLKGAGPLVLSWTSRARSVLRLPAGRDVHYLVYRLPSAALVAEAWSDPKRRVGLALPAGRFLVQRRARGQYGAAEVQLPYGGQRSMGAGDFRSLPYKLLAQKGGAIRLHPNELELGYGFVAGGRTELGHSVQLRYGYLWPELALTAGLQLGLTSHSSGVFDLDERWLGGDLQLQWRPVLGPLTLVMGAGGAWRVTFQRKTRLDAQRLERAGYETEQSFSALGLGPAARLGLAVPLFGPWQVFFGGSVVGLVVREGEELSIHFNALAESALGLHF